MTHPSRIPDDVVVRYIEYPSDGRHVVTVHLEPVATDHIYPFAGWVLEQFDTYLREVTGVKVGVNGCVRISFSRKEDGGVVAGLTAFSRVDREKFAHTLRPTCFTQLKADALVIRGADLRHVGTKVTLTRTGGECFDTDLEDAIADMAEVVAGVQLDREKCEFMMAVPAVNDRRGDITVAVETVAERLRGAYDAETLPVIDSDPELAMLPAYSYVPSPTTA